MATVRMLARDLRIPEHDAWVMLADLVRAGGWSAVFGDGNDVTDLAEQAVRERVAECRR